MATPNEKQLEILRSHVPDGIYVSFNGVGFTFRLANDVILNQACALFAGEVAYFCPTFEQASAFIYGIRFGRLTA